MNDYTANIPAEPLEYYRSGGFHPVRLNDTFKNGRYKILDKLGYGSFATVWLAEDTHNQLPVSLKIVEAQLSLNAQKKEIQVLTHIAATGDENHPGFKHVSRILDHFYHDGVNGRHLCLVANVLGPSLTSMKDGEPSHRLGIERSKRFSRQALFAVDYLHSCGVAHGDVHMGNILLRIPESETSCLQTITAAIGEPIVSEVYRRDGGAFDDKHMATQLTYPKEYWSEGCEDLLEIELVDFGEAFFAKTPPERISTPTPFHPPELVLGRPLSKTVDMWGLACMTYELVVGRTPFETWGAEDEDLLEQFQGMLGGLPDEWIQEALDAGKIQTRPEIEDDTQPFGISLREDYARFGEDEAELTEEGLDALQRYLQRMLVVDPALREKPYGLLSDPWIVQQERNGELSEIKKQTGWFKN